MLIRNKFNGYSTDGVRTYYFGSGGGGESNPSQTQTQIAELPEWARGYAQQTLAQGEALAQKPYARYTEPRFAGFSPLQLETQRRIAGMGPAGQIGEASDIASLAGAQAFQAGQYAPGQFSGGTFTPGAAGFYMSPFMEQAMAPQLREAQRTSDILGTQQAGQAVQAGAFGGSRAGLLEAERQRNLGTQLGDIRARGYQTAYEQAAQQFNQDMQRRMQAQQLGEQSRQFGAGLGIQGLGTALQAASQLGQLGQLGFGQQKDILGMQKEVGAEQQALRQKGLEQSYQDFLAEQNYPYKQLGFMSDLIRGLPLGQQSSRQIYEAGPTPLQTIGSIGAGLYGAKQLGMFGSKEGGVVSSMAEGGSVTDERFVADALEKLSDQQLAQAEQVAMARGDRQRLAMIAEEKAIRASERRGLAGAFNQIPQAQQEQMARGGIVAFAGDDESYVASDEEEDDEYASDQNYVPGTVDYGDSSEDVSAAPSAARPERRSLADLVTAARTGREAISGLYGPSYTEKFGKDIAAQRAALADRREENKGLVALAAAQALSKGSGLRQGLGNMFGAVGSTAGALNKDLRDSERLIRQSEMEMAKADQARQDGQLGLALQYEQQADADRQVAFDKEQQAKLKREQLQQQARLEQERTTAAAQRTKDLAAARVKVAEIAASKTSDVVNQINLLAEGLKETNPDLSNAQARAQATQMFISRNASEVVQNTEIFLQERLSKDPTIKDDPRKLAKARADSARDAINMLKGLGARANALEVQWARIRQTATSNAQVDPEWRNAERVLKDPKASAADKDKARTTQQRVLDRYVGRTTTEMLGAGETDSGTSTPRTYPSPTPAAIQALKDGAGTREQFDAQFGPGAAERVLGK